MDLDRIRMLRVLGFAFKGKPPIVAAPVRCHGSLRERHERLRAPDDPDKSGRPAGLLLCAGWPAPVLRLPRRPRHHVDIVIHNYRWRLGLAAGERKYDELEKRLAAGPTISVPTITLESDANGAPHPEPSSYAEKFTGRYEHRHIDGGIGHNLPQEHPVAFVRAIIDVAAG
jgi:hypothetical protein